MGELTEQEEMALYESELKALMEMYPEDYVYPEDNTSIKDVIKSAARLGGALGLLGLKRLASTQAQSFRNIKGLRWVVSQPPVGASQQKKAWRWQKKASS